MSHSTRGLQYINYANDGFVARVIKIFVDGNQNWFVGGWDIWWRHWTCNSHNNSGLAKIWRMTFDKYYCDLLVSSLFFARVTRQNEISDRMSQMLNEKLFVEIFAFSVVSFFSFGEKNCVTKLLKAFYLPIRCIYHKGLINFRNEHND